MQRIASSSAPREITMLWVICCDLCEKAIATPVKLPTDLLCIPKEITVLPLLYWLRFSLEFCKCKLIDHPGLGDTATLKDYSPFRSCLYRHKVNYYLLHIMNRYHLLQATCCPSPRRCKPSSAYEHILWASPAFRSVLYPHRYLLSSKRLQRSPTGSTYID